MQKGEVLEDLVVARKPMRVRYKPGARVSYKGARFEVSGADVTDRVTFDYGEGSAWEAGIRRRVVRVTYVDDEGQAHVGEFTLKRVIPLLPLFTTCVAAIAIVVAAYFAWQAFHQPEASNVGPDTGSKLISQGDMTDEEAIAMLNEQAEKSRITVSVASNMELADSGQLHVNFIVPEDNNGLSERLEVSQDGQVVYASGIVPPGYKIDYGQALGAHEGEAVATVYAVDDNGYDSGNPVAVEVHIVAASEQ